MSKIHGVAVGSTHHHAQGRISWGTGQDRHGSCPTLVDSPAANTNIGTPFTVAYSAYIPFDHVTGPTNCPGTSFGMIYMGDANRNTYRATESILIVPDAQMASGFFRGAGETRNYSVGSPVNGSTLTGADEDGIADDCHFWNKSGTANSTGLIYDTSYPVAHQGQVHFSGTTWNPLENDNATITWDMRTVISTTNPAAPTAIVNYNHTCFPAHQIKVNGKVVYLYTPPQSNIAYIFNCLALHLNKVVGQQTSTTTVPVQ